jgi:4-amino-4-deoxy-L-arabinose transferase-like glycosyltransferase
MSSVTSVTSPAEIDRTRASGRFLALVGSLTMAVLIGTAGKQIYDSNLVSLPEATSILAGDRPYRDFFEWGAPLAAYLSAGAQLLVGYRLIGEFVLQWVFIAGGVVIAFHLGRRLSRSIAALIAVLPLVLVVLAVTPTYHYSKLFFFPVMVWLAWRYMDRPSLMRSAVFGITSAIAFLFRHDYGIYATPTFFTAVALATPVAGVGRLRAAAIETVVCGLAAAVLVAPWAIAVQLNERFIDYVRATATMYEKPDQATVYPSLLRLNPLLPFTPRPIPEPKPAEVGFFWDDRISDSLRHDLEQRYKLRPLGHDRIGRWRYEAANLYDVALLDLDPYITDGVGFDWDRLHEIRLHLPGRDNALEWVEQVTLLVPLVLVLSGGIAMWRGWRRADGDVADAKRMVMAGLFLGAVDSALLRQPSYTVAVAPLTFALAARFLVVKSTVGRACAIIVLLVTSVGAIVWARESLLFRPIKMVSSVPGTFAQLLASPPDGDKPSFHYLRDCTVPGDHLLVTGMTPFEVNYYTQRPFAGGHVYWRTAWRSSPAQEARSLALLQAQSVPFAISNRRPVLEDFAPYPRIEQYLKTNYIEVEGTDGWILVDRRRRPVGRFVGTAMPCFR